MIILQIYSNILKMKYYVASQVIKKHDTNSTIQ